MSFSGYFNFKNAFYFFKFLNFSLIFLLRGFFKEWPISVLQYVGWVKVISLVGDNMFLCVSPAFGKLRK